MTIVELGAHDTALGYAAMRELRPHLRSPEEFTALVREQRAEGYRLIASLDTAGTAVAVLGFHLLRSLSRGLFLYVDDLSTLPSARCRGHATGLLCWVEAEANRCGCAQIRLDSGTQRHDAHRRYLTAGYTISALHFARALPDETPAGG